ncbi:MAG: NAD-dependent epimerase/dehydratase family protein [Planctomycetota bacterium]
MRPPEPVAFVFGATGYAGAATVEAASRIDHVSRVVAHVRPGSSRADAVADRFRPLGSRVSIDRTPLEPEAMAEALARIAPTHVFLCHGTTAARARVESIEDPYEAVDVGLTRLVVEASRRIEPAPRVVALSSVGASTSARSKYLHARGRAEEVIRSSGLPHTICRAPLFGGPDRPERRNAENIARIALDPLLTLIGGLGLTRLRDRYRSMDGAEVAEGLVRSGFHYMTIDRVVESDELRRVGVYERERWTPRSRRDTSRH